MKNTFIHIQIIQVSKTHSNVEKKPIHTHTKNKIKQNTCKCKQEFHRHEEYIHTHTKNTSKHDTYKCRKEHIHTHIKNTFIPILKSIQNKTFRNKEEQTL